MIKTEEEKQDTQWDSFLCQQFKNIPSCIFCFYVFLIKKSILVPFLAPEGR